VWRDPRSDSDGGPQKGQRFLFTGKELDEETGLVYFGARYYEPERARWLAADPALAKYIEASTASPRRGMEARDLSLYSYGHQVPVVAVDPDGNEVAMPVSYRWSNSRDTLHRPNNPYLVATYAVYPDDVKPTPGWVPASQPISTFEMAFEARQPGKKAGYDNILSDTASWICGLGFKDLISVHAVGSWAGEYRAVDLDSSRQDLPLGGDHVSPWRAVLLHGLCHVTRSEVCRLESQ
jgi:RHS repeat-associated protein